MNCKELARRCSSVQPFQTSCLLFRHWSRSSLFPFFPPQFLLFLLPIPYLSLSFTICPIYPAFLLSFPCLFSLFLFPSSSFPLFFSSPPPPLLLSFLSPRLFFTFFPFPFLPIPLPFLFSLIYMLSLLSPFSAFTAPIFTKRPLNTGIYSLRSQNNGFP